MKKIYLILTILGFIAPNLYVAKVSYETGNVLLWLDPMSTFSGMFANDISSAFAIDLLVVVLVFFIWSFNEAKKHGMKAPYMVWLLTMMFGLAGGLPLFLYQREAHLEQENS